MKTNKILAKDDENQVSSWPHCGYGESGSGIFGKISQNKNFANGGQTGMCMDAGRFLIHVLHYANDVAR